MFAALARSWRLAKASLSVLRKDPELMLFPVISFISLIVVCGGLAGIGLGVGAFAGDEGFTAVGVLFLVLLYFVAYFLVIYFQVALVACVKLRLAGGNPNVWYGLAEANKRLGAIASWAVVAALVGLLLRALETAAERIDNAWVRIPAQLIVRLVGFAWSMAVFFVIPVIAYEGVGGLEVLKRSTGLVTKRWGEAVIGQVGIGLAVFLLSLVPFSMALLGIGLVVGGADVAGFFFLALGVLGILLLAAMGSALQSIYTASLYEYAMSARVANEFSQTDLNDSFRPTERRYATF